MEEKSRKKKRFLSNSDKEKICKMYVIGNSCSYIAKYFNSDPSHISKITKMMGVWQNRSKRACALGNSMSLEQINQLKKLNKLGLKYTEISKVMGIPLDSIKKTGIRSGLVGHKRKYKLDENWLNEIDCPAKAIFLGLFFADGCNVSNSTSNLLYLKEEDKKYLQRINDFFTSKPLHKRRMKKYTDKNRNDQFGISISSKKWSDNLSKYGAIPRKTLVLSKCNFLPKEFEKYFIRGFFEGDGCLTKHKIGRGFSFSLFSTRKFLEYCSEIIHKNTGIKSNIYNPKGQKISVLRISKNSDTYKVMKWLYSDNLNLAMERKLEKANLLFSILGK